MRVSLKMANQTETGGGAFANGDKYEGNWEHGLENGDGTYTFANGHVYEGTFSTSDVDQNKYTVSCTKTDGTKVKWEKTIVQPGFTKIND